MDIKTIPIVSIVINNFNYESYIRQCIESALAQTYQNIEVIIVDDGSTDGSRAIIDEYKKRCRVILKENGGQASALNAGIAESRGKFVLLLDSDDYLYPDAIDVCIKSFPMNYSRIYYRLEFVDEKNNPIIGKRGGNNFEMFDGDIFIELVKRNALYVVATSGNLFDGNKLRAVLPIPETKFRICADIYLFIKTAHSGPVRSIDRRLAAYRIHDNNNFCPNSRVVNKNRLKNQVENIFLSTELIEEGCKKAGLDYKYRIIERNFVVLNTICAAYKMNIESRRIYELSTCALFRLSILFLRLGEEQFLKRIFHFVYLLAVILLPQLFASQLVRLMHWWMNR